MLWKNSWEPEAVLALIGLVVASLVVGNLACVVLQGAGVPGFKSEVSPGNILLATLCFHGVVIVAGAAFLRRHGPSWREALGPVGWRRCLGLAALVLLVTTPVMFAAKYVSGLLLERLGLPVEDQTAVTLILGARPAVCAYLAFFAAVLAPIGEEFFFRGILFSAAKRCGWPRLGWFGVSFIFAFFHLNAPTFLPLFILALALTWLYEKTGGLLAPMLAHSLFNSFNLAVLLLAEKYGHLTS